MGKNKRRMKIKVDDINYEIEVQLPDELQNAITVQMTLETWADLIKGEKRKELRKLRSEKIKQINDRLD